jgi:hypothetical protein
MRKHIRAVRNPIIHDFDYYELGFLLRAKAAFDACVAGIDTPPSKKSCPAIKRDLIATCGKGKSLRPTIHAGLNPNGK